MGLAAWVSRHKWLLGGGAVGLFALASASASETEAILSSGNGTIKVRLTGYWPFTAVSAAERLMEGGHTDSHGNPLYTLEMFQRGEAPYVSVSGDDAIWPYGQRISIDSFPGVEFRVVDTGRNFRGLGKVYRIFGREPLDICVDSSATVIPNATGATATIYQGDAYGSRKTPEDIQWDLFEGQSSV